MNPIELKVENNRQPIHIPQVLTACVLTRLGSLFDTRPKVLHGVSVAVFTFCLLRMTGTRSYPDNPLNLLLWADSSVGRATGF